MLALRWLIGLVVVLAACPVSAHEMRPGYLEVREVAPHRYHVVWKHPALGDMRLRIDPSFPPSCAIADRVRQQVPGAYVDRMTLTCDGGLPGRSIAVAGLEATMTDAFVRIELADGRTLSAILKPNRPAFAVPASGSWSGAWGHLALGVEHILLGVDHLLFVLGLLLLVGPRWLLLKTITAFTVGHSVTLALATLGVVSVPGPPLEAAIALSIVFLAAEIMRVPAGRAAPHRAVSLGRRLRVRPAPRARLRQRADRGRAAALRHPARPGALQRRRRGRPARSSSRPSSRSAWPGVHSTSARRRGPAPRRSTPSAAIAMFWFAERVSAVLGR